MKILTEYLAEDFLEREGFPVIKRGLFKDSLEAFKFARHIGFPVVLKLVSNHVLHKTDIGGVILDVKEDNFSKSFNTLMKLNYKKEGVLVQQQIAGDYILLGLKKNNVFGHVVTLAIGGIFTEIIKDVSFRVAPLTKKDAEEMLKELKGYPILAGVRNHKIDIKKILAIILKLSDLANKYPDIKELDINPLVINSKEAKIVDARIIFSSND